MPAKRVKQRSDRHTKSMVSVHMVFSPKYRAKVLVGAIAKDLERILRDVCAYMGIEIIDLAVNPDHVHLFLQYPPKYSISQIANKLKGASSRELRAKYPELKKWCPKALWAPSCFHGSVGHGAEVVSKYIQNQESHHRRDFTSSGKKQGR